MDRIMFVLLVIACVMAWAVAIGTTAMVVQAFRDGHV